MQGKAPAGKLMGTVVPCNHVAQITMTMIPRHDAKDSYFVDILFPKRLLVDETRPITFLLWLGILFRVTRRARPIRYLLHTGSWSQHSTYMS